MLEYTDKQLSKMRYYYKELQDKLKKSPNSLCINNALVRIEEILNLPKTVSSVDIDNTPENSTLLDFINQNNDFNL
jgi:hypothetical protein